MADSNVSYENRFSEWLAKQVSPAQLSAIYSVFAAINSYCLSRKILKKALFETDNPATLSNVRDTIERSKVFAFKYRKQKSTMLAAIRYYCRFIKEEMTDSGTLESKHTSNANFESADKESSTSASLIDLLVANKISFIDNRNKNGCLWIIGGEELRGFTDACSARGVTFHFKADGARATEYSAAWWTTDDFNISANSNLATSLADDNSGSKPAKVSSSEEGNRLRFIRWLYKREVSTADIFVVALSLKHCSDLAKAAKIIDDDIYHVASVEIIHAIRSFLIADKEFVNKDHKEGNQFTNAINLYSEFFTEQLIPSVNETIVDPGAIMDTSVEAAATTASEIETLLNDEIFAPLKVALAKENIHTIEELKALKLWAFMNQNNLYSISMRQTVLSKVRQLFEQATAGDPELLYELHCGLAVYSGDTLSKAFLHFCEDIAKKYPLFFRSLLNKPIGINSNVSIYRSAEDDNYIRMENPTCYVRADLSKEAVVSAVEWILKRSSGENVPVSIKEPTVLAAKFANEGMPQDESADAALDKQNESCEPFSNSACNQQLSLAENGSGSQAESDINKAEVLSTNSAQIANAEKLVLAADMNGVTCDDLYNALNLTMAATKALIRQCKRIVEIKGKLYHEDAFIDWDDGANQMCLITEKLMQKNNGYISCAQLYDYARTEMNLFLNDNNVNDERSVYDIAQHLFEKNSFGDNSYSFTGKTHISNADDAIGSNFDVICKFAEDKGGVFREEDLVEYLESMGLKVNNLRGQMRLGKEAAFFLYDSGTVISAKSMRIDDAWKDSVDRALKQLLRDADDHIILRQIQPVWFDALPALPDYRRWTPLLLQCILRFYGKEFGAKTIIAMESQNMDVLHTMLVKADGLIQNFGDAVIACLIESEIEQRSFEADELRQLLIKTGMIQGNQLLWNMPKALANDERFAWDAAGENVTVRV